MAPKVVLFEGLPGSGKSTAARLFYELCKENGLCAKLYLEGDQSNPADYEGTAYLTPEELASLEQEYPQKTIVLDQISTKHLGGYLLPYRKAADEGLLFYEEDLFQSLSRYDIYELALDLHQELVLERWRSFVEHCVQSDEIIVLECCFIQNPVTVFMVKHDKTAPEAEQYIRILEGIIRPLDPLLLYVDQQDLKASFLKAVRERPEYWFEGFAQYYTSQGYGLHHGLKGMEGILRILNDRQELERSIYDSLKINKQMIDNSRFDKEQMREQLSSIIEKLRLTGGDDSLEKISPARSDERLA